MPAIVNGDNSPVMSSSASAMSLSDDILSLGIPRVKRPKAVTLPYMPSPNPFHTLDIYFPAAGLSPSTKWLIFLHGGYWRDANQSKDVGAHVLTRMPVHWAGASIDYRLSPEILHPDHLTDVTKAMTFLRTAYGIHDAVIVAHGAGACIGFQYLAARLSLGETWIKRIVGSGGVYDLVDVGIHNPEYKQYILEAFGDEMETWDLYSPTHCEWRSLCMSDLKITLVHSKHDHLVSLNQAVRFDETLRNAGFQVDLRLLDIMGHDDVLETSELASVVLEVCNDLEHEDEQNQPRSF
ncbi:alpha/beta-hydrolase [Nadsonia fulvescens var. elongata DSM 6958]|uniref:Alpha/beta-hydrolase n=1 Tax=Nadsonia fulvescens var. elongata DSM 6958 TaxID=857566 RepID=A0A1E3PFT8_9ASCO|nr:alpha/beta-hydrolase [Nadsonia fulvescens var. elongata DSM 6958]